MAKNKKLSVDEFQKLKAKAESLQREADKAQGALDAALASLRDEFGCESLQDAEKLLVGLEAEVEKLEGKAARLLDAFLQQWGERLDADT